MHEAVAINTQWIQQWTLAKSTPELIEKELRDQGIDNNTISAHLKAFRKLRNEKKQFAAFACMGSGAVLGFISLVLSITNPVPEYYNFFLFGLTSMAILIVFTGLYLLFE
jgi:hypothetical protein